MTESNVKGFLSKNLHEAAQNNDFEAAKAMLQRGDDVNALTEDGWTALHFAASKGYRKIIDLLIAAKINVDAAGKVYHRTALHYAAHQGQMSAVKALLDAGADSSLCDKSGKDASQIASERGFVEIADLITNHQHFHG